MVKPNFDDPLDQDIANLWKIDKEGVIKKAK